MTDEPWVRLSRRNQSPTEPEAPYEGVPDHLRMPLWQWLRQWGDAEAILVEFRIRQEVDDSWNELGDLTWDDSALFLDAIDFVLTHGTFSNAYDRQAVDKLRRLLDRGGSAWRVAPRGRALERRIDQTVAQAVSVVALRGTNPGKHLAAAWQATYGRHQDPAKAYSEAIKAVEAAAIPVVEPNNAKATLGTVLGALRADPSRWRLAILGPDRSARNAGPLIVLLELLWQGQSDRHAGTTPVVPISSEAALMAVHLAATLVQWFTSGTVQEQE